MKARWLVRQLGLVLVLVATATGCFSTRRSPATLGDAELSALAAFPQDDWDAVLERFVDARGRVDYAALVVDRAGLERYVALLASVGPTTRPELFPDSTSRLAYYLNAYNALAIFNVIDRGEPAPVGEHKVDFFYFTCFPLDGQVVNLYDLENEIVRERFDEPRIHFALNCASRACPRLPDEAFDAARLDEQLARLTTAFLHEPRNVTVQDGRLVLSELFDWYAEDFPPDPPAWIRGAAPDLLLPAGLPVDYRPWDWSLNDPGDW